MDNARGNIPYSASAQAPHEKRTFASFKFEWMKALAADPRLEARAKMIGNCILGHVNQHSGEATLSDRAISDETAIPERGIVRGRGPLRKHGWIDWRRTGGANVYRVLSDNMPAMNDRLARLKSQRNADAESRKGARRVAPPVAERNHRSDPPPVAERTNHQPDEISQFRHCDALPMAQHVQPWVADKHLNLTPTLTPTIPPRFARRAGLEVGFDELAGTTQQPITIKQWIEITPDKTKRTAVILPIATDLGLSEEQTLDYLSKIAKEWQDANMTSCDWPAQFYDYFLGVH
jgi:hypothetical protein